MSMPTLTPLDPAAVYAGQTEILKWLKSRGHQVMFARDLMVPRVKPARSAPEIAAAVVLVNALTRAIGLPCPYCRQGMRPGRGPFGRQAPTRDHVIPKRGGGTLAQSNVLIVCRACNEDKSDYTLAGWHLRLVREGDPRADIVAGVIRDRMTVDAFEWPAVPP